MVHWHLRWTYQIILLCLLASSAITYFSRPNWAWARCNDREFSKLHNKLSPFRQIHYHFVFYIDNGSSILLFFFPATLTCFVIFMHRSNNNVMHTRIKASCICLKYKETAEKTRKANITSSHITKATTSTLEVVRLEVDAKNETEAQSCLDRSWYSLNWSAKLDRVIMASLFLSLPFDLKLCLALEL